MSNRTHGWSCGVHRFMPIVYISNEKGVHYQEQIEGVQFTDDTTIKSALENTDDFIFILQL